jgi:hypothetical protein
VTYGEQTLSSLSQINFDNVKFEAYYKNKKQNFAGSAPVTYTSVFGVYTKLETYSKSAGTTRTKSK